VILQSLPLLGFRKSSSPRSYDRGLCPSYMCVRPILQVRQASQFAVQYTASPALAPEYYGTIHHRYFLLPLLIPLPHSTSNSAVCHGGATLFFITFTPAQIPCSFPLEPRVPFLATRILTDE
jgi:hypothetical protein